MTRRVLLIFLPIFPLMPWGCSSFEHEYVPDDDSASHGDDDLTDDDDGADDDTGGGTPQISVSPPAIYFVDIVDETATGTGIRIYNTGTADLFVTGISLVEVVDGLHNATWSGSIPPDFDQPIEDVVVADCHTVGTMDNYLRITSNDPVNPYVDLNVHVDCMDAAR